tara:strand:- start:86 stop:673 length:588 start_codon:yes stop_codon:yes gene_type:complete
MKKFLGIIIVGLLLSVNAYASLNGQGKLKLSDYVLDALINYLNPDAVHNKTQGSSQKGNPMYFAVSVSGTEQSYTYCPRGSNCRQDPGRVTNHCKKRAGEKCYIFASRRKIVWDGINYKFKRKASALEIKSKLKEWGFIGDSISSNTNATPKITKKTNITDKDDIVSQLKDLKKLLDNDVITQDEFDKIKKKLIN